MRSVDPKRLVFVDECSTNIATVARYARAPKGQRAYGKAPRNWGGNVTLVSSITLEGMGPSMSIEGSADGESFGFYLKNVLCPSLKRGRIVVMDNLSVHKSKYVRELVEEKGCELWFLPAYSPDLNPIEEAFSKAKGIRRGRRPGPSKPSSRPLGKHYERSVKKTLADSSATADTLQLGLTYCEKRFKLSERAPRLPGPRSPRRSLSGSCCYGWCSGAAFERSSLRICSLG